MQRRLSFIITSLGSGAVCGDPVCHGTALYDPGSGKRMRASDSTARMLAGTLHVHHGARQAGPWTAAAAGGRDEGGGE